MRVRSASTLERPTRKKPSVTFTATAPASGGAARLLVGLHQDTRHVADAAARKIRRQDEGQFRGVARRQRGVGVMAERHRHLELAVGNFDVSAHGDFRLLVAARLDRFGAPDHRADILLALRVRGPPAVPPSIPDLDKAQWRAAPQCSLQDTVFGQDIRPPEQKFRAFEQIFGANQQILHLGGDYKEAIEAVLAVRRKS